MTAPDLTPEAIAQLADRLNDLAYDLEDDLPESAALVRAAASALSALAAERDAAREALRELTDAIDYYSEMRLTDEASDARWNVVTDKWDAARAALSSVPTAPEQTR